MMARKTIDAEPAARVPAAAPVDEAGQETGLVEVKTRLPIHLHIALQNAAERNLRSLAAELRLAALEHVEREAARR